MKYVFVGGDKTLSYRNCGVKFEDGKVYDENDYKRYIENHSVYFEEESIHIAKSTLSKKCSEVGLIPTFVKVENHIVDGDIIRPVPEDFDVTIVTNDELDEEILVDEDAKIVDDIILTRSSDKLDQDIINFLESDNREEFLNNGLHWKKIAQIAEYLGLEWTKKDSTIKNIMEVVNEDNK